MRWHLWEIDLRFALNSTSGWTKRFSSLFAKVIPHGATDHLVGDFLCRPACPRAWLIPFAAVLPPPCVPYELI